MAELRVGNRASEAQTAVPWEQPLTLVWSRPEDRPQRLRWGGCPIDEVTSPFRVPWLPSRLTWEDASGAHATAIRVDESVRPDEARVDVVRGFARTLRRIGPVDLDSVKDVPLFSVTALWAALESGPVDDLLQQTIGTVVEACTRPRSWLREERVVQPVGRVRRPARDAIRHLSRHPEHAGTDGLRVFPERILASVQEDDLDLYENRVLIAIVQRLLRRAVRQQASLRLALEKLDELRQDIDRAHAFGQYRRWGILKKAAEGKDLGHALERGEQRRLTLARQVQSLTGCLDTALGQALRFSTAPTELRETNILTWDPRYQVLPLLWRALDVEDRKQSQPLDAVLDDVDRTWVDFCLLTLLRALLDVGFSGGGPVPLTTPSGGAGRVSLRQPNPNGDWIAEVRRDETSLTLDLSREVPAPPPPVVRRPTKSPPPRPAVRRVSSTRFVPTFSGDARPAIAGVNDVWLQPHSLADLAVGDRDSGRLRSTVYGNNRSIAVSPWSFGSVDRLARLLQIGTLGVELGLGEIRLQCPSCQGVARAIRDGAVCTNAECGTSWGVRSCGCGARIPKLHPRLPGADALNTLIADHVDPSRRMLLAEMLGGRDLLADWCLDDSGVGQRWMVCPSCGRCGNSSCSSPICKEGC